MLDRDMLANIFLYKDDLDSEATGCGGLVCVYSLKNPAHPEYSCAADSGVMSLHFHPGHAHMLVAGLASGNVAVYNLQHAATAARHHGLEPAYQSRAGGGKHRDTVWQVRWLADDLDNYLNFFSGNKHFHTWNTDTG